MLNETERDGFEGYIKQHNYNYNQGVFLDERNKRFVDMNLMDQISHINYKNTFKNYRPDFYGYRAEEYDQKHIKEGIFLLGYMYDLRRNEITKMLHLFRGAFYSYSLPLYEYHYKLGKIDRANPLKFYYWDDASKIGAYYDYVLRRIRKYGLHWGALKPTKFDNYKEQIKKEEDELVDYFLYEMRKPPTEEAFNSMKI